MAKRRDVGDRLARARPGPPGRERSRPLPGLAGPMTSVPSAASATDAGVRVADGDIAARADVGQRRAGRLADRGVGHGPAADQCVPLGDGRRVAGGDRGQVEATQTEGRRGRRRRDGAHGTIFSIGSTRIPDAPAPFRRGSRPQTSSAPTTVWTATMPSWASGMTVGDSRAGRRASSSGRWTGRRVHHQVLAAARGDHGAEHRVDRRELVGALALRGRVGHEDGLAGEDVADLAQPVHDQGRAGRHEVDDAPRPGRAAGPTSTAPEIGHDVDVDAALARRSDGRCSGGPSRHACPARSSTVRNELSVGTAAASRQRP